NYNVTDKTGKIADVLVVNDEDDILVITDDGTIIRMSAANISMLSRATQGVRIMRIMDGSRVICIEKTDREEESEEDTEAETDGE
uniref:DNA gyrase C-terminal beta-propeller domain-containing protein n=1 Tax=Candidatus Limivicinus sp. TaxID=3030905 RepID=UPI003FEEAE39